MADGLQVARLIPVSGIDNNAEAEMRATSALLAVLRIVRDFSISVLSPLGASTARKATVEAFIETSFKLNDGTVVRPDGLVQVTYGTSTWKALVEVKTGSNNLQAEQLNNYLALARQQSIDTVLTISNEIAIASQHPCDGVKIRSNSRVSLRHLSWTEVLARAVKEKVHRGVSDPEQAWILGELIRYLEHPASGAMDLQDMGQAWPSARDAARAGTLRRTDPECREITQRWDQLVRFAALRLGSSTGADVVAIVPRAQADPDARLSHLAEILTRDGRLEGRIRIPGTAGDLVVAADLRARQITTSANVQAPTDRGNRARITWLQRQLGPDAPKDLIIEAWPHKSRQPLVASIADAEQNRDLLLDPNRRELARFTLVRRTEMGQNRKNGARSPAFIESTTTAIDSFYASVLQQIIPWSAPPPKAKQEQHTPDNGSHQTDDGEAPENTTGATHSARADTGS